MTATSTCCTTKRWRNASERRWWLRTTAVKTTPPAVAVPGLNPVDNTQDQVQRYLNRVNGQADGDGLYIH